MTPEIRNGILQHLLSGKPADSDLHVLWVADSGDGIPPQLQCDYCPPASQALSTFDQSSFDYAVLADLPGDLGKPTAEALLARMRDINAQRVFWVVQAGAPWEKQEIMALGFRELQHDESEALYGFDIENYKHAPDWLNARHWANPERWDKERW